MRTLTLMAALLALGFTMAVAPFHRAEARGALAYRGTVPGRRTVGDSQRPRDGSARHHHDARRVYAAARA